MPNIFKPKRSTTASSVPTTSNLADGELAVNIADQKIYVRSGVSIVTVADVGGGGAGGVNYWDQTAAGINTISNIGIGTTNPTSKLYVNGDAYFVGVVTASTYYGKARENITNISSNYSIQYTDSVILATGTIDVTMPSAVGLVGDKYYVKNVGVGTVTIKGSGAELIDDYTEMILGEKNSSITLISNNSKWLIF